jgi:hypothetical protein
LSVSMMPYNTTEPWTLCIFTLKLSPKKSSSIFPSLYKAISIQLLLMTVAFPPTILPFPEVCLIFKPATCLSLCHFMMNNAPLCSSVQVKTPKARRVGKPLKKTDPFSHWIDILLNSLRQFLYTMRIIY